MDERKKVDIESKNTLYRLWGLGSVIFFSIIVIGIVIYFTYQDVAEQRKKAAQNQQIFSRMIQESHSSLQKGSSAFYQLFLENYESNDSSDKWIEGLESYIPIRQNLFLTDAQQQVFNRYLVKVASIKQHYHVSIAWSQNYARSVESLGEIEISVTNKINEMSEALSKMSGLERLKRIAIILSPTIENDRMGQGDRELVRMGTVSLSNLRAIQKELDDLSNLQRALYLSSKIDTLASMKENNFSPTILRLQREVSALSANPSNTTMPSSNFEQIFSMLFGINYYHDITHQTLITGDGGMYNKKIAHLTAKNRGAELFKRYQEISYDLNQSHFDLTQIFEQENQLLNLESEQIIKRSVLLLIIIAFIIAAILGWATFRIVKQVSQLQVLRDLNNELESAKKYAEENSKAKGNFLAKMSHEIRTPMNGMLGMSELLQETPLNTQQKDYLKVMREAGKTLLVVINDILDFSKYSTGNLEFDSRPVNYRTLAKDALLPYKLTKSDNIEYYLEIDDEVPEFLMTDPARFNQVISNLLNNAKKFTHKGEIHFRTHYLGQNGDGTISLQIEVEDTGIGMSTATIAKIFDEFEQADASTSRIYGGSGLGLTICNELVKLAGGEMWAESKAGKGSIFYIRVNLSPTETSPKNTKIKTDGNELPDLSNLNILVAEDNATNQLIIKHTLQLLGIVNFLVVENGAEAVEKVCDLGRTYHAVFMDCEMPIMDGYEAATIIRQWERDSHLAPIAICALTAHAMDEHRQKTKEAGMNYHISKPISIETIRLFCESLTSEDRKIDAIKPRPLH